MKLFSLIFAVAVLAITARELGPEGRGDFAVIISVVALFSTCFGLSLGQVTAHQLATSENQRSGMGTLFGSLLAFTCLGSLIAWATAWFLYNSQFWAGLRSLPLAPLVIGFSVMPFLIWEQYGSQLLYFVARYGTHNKLVVVGNLLSLVILYMLLSEPDYGLLLAVGAMLPSQMTAPLVGVFILAGIIKLSGSKIRIRISEISILLRAGCQLHVATIGGLAASSLTVLIIHSQLGSREAGYFQMAAQLVGSLLLLSQVVCMVMYSEIARKGVDASWCHHKKLVFGSIFATICLALLLDYFAPSIIRIIAGEQFVDVIPIIRTMLLGSVGGSLSILMTPYWVGRGLFLHTGILTLAGAAISLSLLLWLIPKYGVQAGSFSYVATGLFSMLCNGLFYFFCDRKYIAGRWATKNDEPDVGIDDID